MFLFCAEHALQSFAAWNDRWRKTDATSEQSPVQCPSSQVKNEEHHRSLRQASDKEDEVSMRRFVTRISLTEIIRSHTVHTRTQVLCLCISKLQILWILVYNLLSWTILQVVHVVVRLVLVYNREWSILSVLNAYRCQSPVVRCFLITSTLFYRIRFFASRIRFTFRGSFLDMYSHLYLLMSRRLLEQTAWMKCIVWPRHAQLVCLL